MEHHKVRRAKLLDGLPECASLPPSARYGQREGGAIREAKEQFMRSTLLLVSFIGDDVNIRLGTVSYFLLVKCA